MKQSWIYAFYQDLYFVVRTSDIWTICRFCHTLVSWQYGLTC